MIEFHNVAKRYPNGHEALSHVNFRLSPGEMTFLTGHSGAGKSTILKLLMVMERPSSGQIVVGGQDLDKLGAARIPYYRRNIGVVFQDHHLLDDYSVFDNVALPLRVCGYPDREIGKRVRAALDKVGLLDREKYLPVALSGGEQQRVGIARAVVNKPPILIADEPTGNLDDELSAEIMKLFEDFSQVGVTVLIATHDMDLVHRFGHREMVLRRGRLIRGSDSGDSHGAQ
ncbi:MAG TPA: cell division ATP-binding protein FtsE [Pseudomonadales bacterium]|nr:cell division ATP-binding protein FtsE [Pseudomonadales bacterium]